MSRQQEKGLDHFIHPTQIEKSWLTEEVVDPIHTFDSVGNPVLSQSDGPFLPRWQTSPVLPTNIVNENLFENEVFSELTRDCIASKSAVLGGFHIEPPGSSSHPDRMTTFFATLLSMSTGKEVEYPGDPDSHMAIPIFDTLNGTDRKVVGVIESAIYWRWFLRNILPKNDFGITVIIANDCDGSFTYHLDGPEASAIGFGDRHERKFSMYGVEGLLNKAIIEDGTIDGVPFHETSCPYTFHVYPEQEYYDHYVTNEPLVISLSVAAVFAFTIAMFLVYDRLVERRQRLVLAKATQSTAIISSLFVSTYCIFTPTFMLNRPFSHYSPAFQPKQVRDRLLAMETQKNEKRKGDSLVPANHKLKTFLNGNELAPHIHDQPIADFFPNCTVFFADIAGFTAWSSTREPAQVFILLQTVYQNFDLIAKRRRVFKVETIGR